MTLKEIEERQRQYLKDGGAYFEDPKNILELIERVKKLSTQLSEAVRVIEATKGDITYKDVDNNDTVGMLNSAKASFEKTLAYYGSNVELE